MTDLTDHDDGIQADRALHRGARYSAPNDLRISPAAPLRVLIVGSCTSEAIAYHMREDFGYSVDHVLFNNVADLPEKSTEQLGAYDFQFIQLAMRSISPENHSLNTNFDDEASARAYFDACCGRMEQMLDAALAYNQQTGLLTLVSNFLVPQRNLLGRFLPRYELRNTVFFVEELNRHLASLLGRYTNVHMMDADQISAMHGRKYAQDDSVWATSHGALLSTFDYEHDRNRIVPPDWMHDYYEFKTVDLLHAVIFELEAMYRTARQIDQVKLVIIDLDDTLWRGVFAEGSSGTQEGWPLGFTEALAFLKRRGVVLAIVSKNDEALIRENWNHCVWGLLPIESFASIKINWRPKVENIAEVISEVNVLPGSVVFIDDNPAERAAVAGSFPDIRVLGRDPYYLRRVLLWSPELDTVTISRESSARTEMIRAQIDRDKQKDTMPRETFLESLALKVHDHKIISERDPRSSRAFELLNKTNQFNTTGHRWTEAEWAQHFTSGGVVYAFEVEDRFSSYGLTCVAVVHGATIMQFVMSCRVVGLNVEHTALAKICEDIEAIGADRVSALAVETPKNLLSRDLYAKSGFHWADGAWVLDRRSQAGVDKSDMSGAKPGSPWQWLQWVAKIPN